MTDELIPEWIKAIQGEQQRVRATEEHHRTQRILTQKVIEAEGPKFWKQFLKELELAAGACNQTWKSSGLVVNMTSVREVHNREGFKINVTTIEPNHFAEFCEVSYDLGAAHINCLGHYGEQFRFVFDVDAEGRFIAKSQRESFRTVDAEKAAAAVLQPIIREALDLSRL